MTKFVVNANPKRRKQLSNLDQVLDAAMELSIEQQKMLIQILKNRLIEGRRNEIASDAKTSMAEFKSGKFRCQTATEAIQELRQYLNNPNIADV